ncbi:MAG: glycosyltransferase [Bacteroidia bacterium]|nr:glycosyltransferase [Bacteroidia bacterium]
MTTLIVLFVCLLLLSSLSFALVSNGWFRALRVMLPSAEAEDVTIIIAAHNERSNIVRVLDAIRAQDYPADRIRVIIADDRSSDGTAEIARAHAGDLRLDILRIDSTPEGLSPKKHALHLAIHAAHTDILLFTDADCRPEPGWIAGLHRVFAAGAEVVVAPAPLEGGKGFTERYSAYEACRTAAFMIAATAHGVPYMASGRNWGYRKSLYTRCDGLPAVGRWLGGDDDLLLQQFAASGARIAACTEANAFVRSDAPGEFSSLVRQKMRHYRVSGAYSGKAALLLGIIVASQVSVFPLAIILTILFLLHGQFMAAALPQIGLLWMLHYNAGFMMPVTRLLGMEARRTSLAGLECFHVVFSALAGIASFFRPQRW